MPKSTKLRPSKKFIRKLVSIFRESETDLVSQYPHLPALMLQMEALLDSAWGSKEVLAKELAIEIYKLVHPKPLLPNKGDLKRISKIQQDGFKKLNEALKSIYAFPDFRPIISEDVTTLSNLQAALQDKWDLLANNSMAMLSLPKGKKENAAEWSALSGLREVLIRTLPKKRKMKIAEIGKARFHVFHGDNKNRSFVANPERLIANINSVFGTNSPHEKSIIRYFKKHERDWLYHRDSTAKDNRTIKVKSTNRILDKAKSR